MVNSSVKQDECGFPFRIRLPNTNDQSRTIKKKEILLAGFGGSEPA